MATQYRAEYYESAASKKGPYAVTKNEKRWKPSPPTTYEKALATAKRWAGGDGIYRTARVVELNDGVPVSVHWMSVWEKPDDYENETGEGAAAAPAQAGRSVKLQVWMPTDQGPPDHWIDLWSWMQKICTDANNWDLVYGREIDSRGRKTLWSIRLNLWGSDKITTIDEWDWATIFGKSKEDSGDVEFIRSTDIGPREIPAGVETATCTNCAKVHPESRGWLGGGDEEPFCSCLCIDMYLGPDVWRMDPDGQETEDPGCVVQVHATV